MSRQLRVAVVGAGPAGIYAADILTKADLPSTLESVTIDLIERDPTRSVSSATASRPTTHASRRSSRH